MQTEGHSENESVQNAVERGSCILLLAPSLHSGTEEACLDLLSFDQPHEQDVLWVGYTRSPDACVQDWLTHVGDRPRNMHFVSVGDTTRSTSARGGNDPATGSDDEVVETLANPGDLTGLGITLSEVLQRWGDDGNEVTACFDSLTALLQYADLQTAYKFLHVLTGRFEAAGVTAHFHLDPEACDQQTVSTLTSLFDAVVELDDDGGWTVRSR
ncbi:DUF7504 family protein [Halorussus halobius]|uniref:DUF7504 family protein n=1 Tax=Halorussus halobius TaxID=1710537 RepID=UPI001FCE45F6|nr:hypothetical protein [Halorussus halobius]